MSVMVSASVSAAACSEGALELEEELETRMSGGGELHAADAIFEAFAAREAQNKAVDSSSLRTWWTLSLEDMLEARLLRDILERRLVREVRLTLYFGGVVVLMRRRLSLCKDVSLSE